MDRNKTMSDNLFSINVYERRSPVDIPAHWHEYYEIEVCLSGKGVMSINNKDFPIEANTLFFITPSDFHSYKIEEPLELINMTFPTHCMEYSQIQDILFLSNFFVAILSDETRDDIIGLIKQISRECTSKNYMSKKYLSHLMSCLIINLLRLEKTVKKSDVNKIVGYPTPVQQAVYHLISNFKEPITLEGVANTVGVSPSHLSKEFRKSVGIGFKEFLVDLRLKHACQLLVYSNEAITDIAYYCGFNSTSYFLTVFKKRYKMSPLKYRNSEKKLKGIESEIEYDD